MPQSRPETRFIFITGGVVSALGKGIAALAGAHFRIEKSAETDTALTTVEALEGDGVVAELCRMLGAEASDTAARRHAEELLAAA